MAVPCASSRFPVSLACSVLFPRSLGISFVVFMFLPPLLTCWASPSGVPVSVFAGQLLRRYFCHRSLSYLTLDFALRLRMSLSCLLRFPSGFLTWPLLGLFRSSCYLVLSCCSVVFLLCFGTMFAIFSILSVVTGVCPPSSGLFLGLVTPVRVQLLFLGFRFLISVFFPSILFWYAHLLLLS